MAVSVSDDAAGEQDFDVGMSREKCLNGLKCTGQILFVTIQICEYFALCPEPTAIHRVVHPLVFFDEGFYARVAWQPIQRAVIGLRVLHDVLGVHVLLVRDGSHAELKPLRIPIAWSNDREAHVEFRLARQLDSAFRTSTYSAIIHIALRKLYRKSETTAIPI